MLFWILAAGLTVVACLAVLAPLSGKWTRTDGDSPRDLEIYRDQLSELDRDVERGALDRSEYDGTRAEIARRILRLDEAKMAEPRDTPRRDLRAVGAAAVLAVPLISWSVYAGLGSPGLASRPLGERVAAMAADMPADELVARAEAHLRANPDDGKGWDVLAPMYLRLGRTGDAIAAFGQAIRLEGATAGRQAGLGEAHMAASGGIVTADAEAAFRRAAGLDGRNLKARFFLGVAHLQQSRPGDAIASWRELLADLPAGSPWRAPVEQALAQAASRVPGAEGGAPGPSAEQAEAALALSQEDRTAMIETMVAGLDERLRAGSGSVEDWMRLVRSYLILGRPDAARGARDRGLDALGRSSESAAKLMAFSDSLGLVAVE